MSIQLIVYPQTYEGGSNPIATTTQEFVIDGISFSTINASSSYDGTDFVAPIILAAAPPIIVNTWYRWRYPASGTQPDLPTQTSGNLVLQAGDSPNYLTSGVYQRLSNLIIGQMYVVTIETATPSSVEGVLAIEIWQGSSSQIAYVDSSVTGADITLTFTATATDNILFLNYVSNVGLSATEDTITNISIVGKGLSPSGTQQVLGDGQVLCDLYEDEDIPLTLSVDDFKNVAEQVQSYSKAFKLPATKRNNKIFESLFEITRSAQNTLAFNPYVKTQCVLKQDGFILFEGYLKMIDIQDKEGEISYNINLYSEVVALADVLGDRTFSELDFTELQHDYNRTQIKNSWNDLGGGTGLTYTNASTSGYRTSHNTVKYPFVDWNHQIFEGGSGLSSDAAIDMPELGSLETAFRPFINVRYCIDRIFKDTPFSFTSEFFDTDEFQDLFMDFNWGSDNAPSLAGTTVYNGHYGFAANGFLPAAINYATTTYAPFVQSTQIPFIGYNGPPNYNTTTNILTSTVINETYALNYTFKVINEDTVDRTVECQWLYTSGGVTQPAVDYSGVITLGAGQIFTYTGSTTVILDAIGDTLQVQFRTNAGTASKVSQFENPLAALGHAVFYTVSATATTSNSLLQTLRGELGQWEFLKGIMTMFNLVSTPDKSNRNNIIIEPWVDVFGKTENAKGEKLSEREIAHDWTEKIDISEMKLTPLTDLNKKTMFKFVEDEDDYAATIYKNATEGWLYGSEEWDASLSGNGLATLLEGEEEIIAEPFAPTVVKKLMPQYFDFVVPSIYSHNSDDGTSEGFDNSPRIMFNNRKKTLATSTYFIPVQNGVTFENADTFLQFSHLSAVPTIVGTKDFLFASRQLYSGAGSPPTDNLFNLYWLPYLAELYNPDTRTMTIKVNLTAGDISMFSFSDIVYIKNRQFRINSIDYKPNDLATVEFILIP
jgi:hypothetical protein|tara:strand:- start:2460 stop:5285 length:2826 start_codon:yes stop_codon:yes gene_type:complete